MTNLFAKCFQFVLCTVAKHKIDESHGVSHSMNILHHAHNIYQSELATNSRLEPLERVIYCSAILHDMCDKKYMDEKEGVKQIEEFLQTTLNEDETATMSKIMTTMSYSKVKRFGFPAMETPEKETAYHIVREADLLCAYDFDRCMIYNMCSMSKNVGDVNDAFDNAESLFESRVLRHNDDGLFTLDYSRTLSQSLHVSAQHRMLTWRKILNK
jgi:hypothetical protein